MVTEIIRHGEYDYEDIGRSVELYSKLEAENKELRQQLEHYQSAKPAGRKKHNEAWMASYNSFVVDYENGLSIMEIVDKGDISRRTAYRYKAYYDMMKKER